MKVYDEEVDGERVITIDLVEDFGGEEGERVTIPLDPDIFDRWKEVCPEGTLNDFAECIHSALKQLIEEGRDNERLLD